MTKLPQKLFSELLAALLDAFRSYGELEMMARTQLEENLNEIAGANKLGDVVFYLINWAEAKGKLDLLIQGSRKSNPGNPALKEFEEKYRNFENGKFNILEDIPTKRLKENFLGDNTQSILNDHSEHIYLNKKRIPIYDPQYPGLDCVGVDRLKQREVFTDVLIRLKESLPDTKNLLEWYGVPGIGKSSLIQLLIEESNEQNSPYVMIDFNQEKNILQPFVREQIFLITYIVESLEKKKTINSEIVKKAIIEYNSSLSIEDASKYQEKKLEEVRSEFDRFVNRFVMGSEGNIIPLVIFFDGCEKIEGKLSSWIEKNVIEPLIRGCQCLFVWMSRYPRFWGPSMKFYKLSNRLTSFEEGDVRLQLREQLGLLSFHPQIAEKVATKVSQKVFTLTGGHPYANWVIAQQLAGWVNKNLTQDSVGEEANNVLFRREPEIYKQLFNTIIINHAFEVYDTKQRKALELCSLVRCVDASLLRRILRECTTEMDFKKSSNQYFDQLIEELRKSKLLETRGDGSLSLDASLRQIIRGYLIYQDKELYIKVNQTALSFYQESFQGNNGSRILYFVEEIYHIASVNQMQSMKVDIFSVAQKRLNEFPDYVDIVNLFDRLRNTLEADTELADILSAQNVSVFDISDMINQEKLLRKTF